MKRRAFRQEYEFAHVLCIACTNWCMNVRDAMLADRGEKGRVGWDGCMAE